MKTFIMFLLLTTTSAHAAPLYLICQGERWGSNTPEVRQPVKFSITVNGKNVKVEDHNAVPLYSEDDEDTLYFGAGSRAGIGDVLLGQINRITGRAEILSNVTKSIRSSFEGVCKKSKKLF